MVAAPILLLAGLGRADAQTNAGPPTRRLITQGVDLNRMVTLAGNVRPEANSANDRGAVAADFRLDHLQLQLRLPAENQRELDQLTRDQQDPTSPNYHKWLTPAEFKRRFSLAPEDVQAITAWLQSAGFQVEVVNPQSIVFSGTAGEVRSALHTEIHNLDVHGEKHIANMSDPQIPAALAPAVVGIVSLNDFKPRPANRPRGTYTPGNGTLPVVPADLATIYNFNPAFGKGYTGFEQTIVVIEDSDIYTSSDWYSFRNALGLSASYPSGIFEQEHPAPPTGAYDCFDPGAVPGDETEATIDAEWASAAAPNAAIEIASCADSVTNFGGFIALENLLNADGTPPAIVSISYGDPEPELGAAFNAYVSALYQQGASEGVSIFVSAGDSGAAGSDQDEPSAIDGIAVSGFASTAYNVAVGGTDFGDSFAGTTSTYWNSTNTSAYGSANSYIPEIPWNDSCASGLIATYLGYATTYGANGLCNSVGSNSLLLTTGAGSGGPSGCATGAPATSGQVGGSCGGYAKPYWQTLVGNPSDGVRDLPDVSLFSADGYWGHYYVVCWSDVMWGGASCQGAPSTWTGFGGTSFAAPIMAGIQALVNQKTGERQGNPNPIYYALAANEYGSGGSSSCNSTLGNGVGGGCIFYDVTQGDMDVNCHGAVNCYTPSGAYGVLSTSDSAYRPAYGATPGWDFATGIGTVNAYNLVENWPQSGITAVSGVPQTAVIDTQFAAPLAAKITDGSGNPVTGVTVTFRAPASGASGTFAGGMDTATTDSTGTATSPLFTANGTTGSYTVIATAPDIVGTANFSLTNTLSAPASVSVVSGTQQSTTIGTAFSSPLVAIVKDANGDPMSNIAVTFATSCSGSACATFVGSSSTTTSALGQASVSVDANGNAGVYSVTAAVASLSASFALSNTQTTPVSFSAWSGSGQSAAITTTFANPFSVTLVDASDHPVSGAYVKFFTNQSPGPSGTFPGGATADMEITNSSGTATSAAFTANLRVGFYTVNAEAPSFETPGYTLTNTPGPPANIMATSGSLQITTINSDFPQPLVATVTDAGGNPVSAGAQITFSVLAALSGAGATLGGATSWTATTNSSGTVSAYPLLANGTGGSYLAYAIIGPHGGGTLNTAGASFQLTNLGLSLSTTAPGTLQITAGTPASVTLSIGTNPAGVLLGQSVSLSCGVPAGLPGTTCSINPATLQVGHSGASATLTIDTTAKSQWAPSRYEPPTGPLFSSWPAWPWAAALASMCAILFAARRREPQGRSLPALFVLLVVVTIATGLVSCSSSADNGSDSGTSQTSGTPAGASSISVTAQGDGMTATVQIPIDVN